MTLELRPPRDPEWRICRMLLPETFTDGPGREYRLALAGGRLIGAVSFRISGPDITHVRLHVIPPMRRLGAGSAMLAGISQMSEAVEGFVELTREPDAEAFCARNGLVRADSLTTVEAEIDGMRDYLGALRRRLRVPDGVGVVSLCDAPAAEVGALHAACVAAEGGADRWSAMAAQSPELAQSVVVMTEGVVTGILLWQMEGSTAVVRSKAVAPEYRGGGWMNALLMGEAMERGWSAGARRVRFFYTDSTRDTEKLARRFRAEAVGVVARFRRVIRNG